MNVRISECGRFKVFTAEDGKTFQSKTIEVPKKSEIESFEPYRFKQINVPLERTEEDFLQYNDEISE